MIIELYRSNKQYQVKEIFGRKKCSTIYLSLYAIWSENHALGVFFFFFLRQGFGTVLHTPIVGASSLALGVSKGTVR